MTESEATSKIESAMDSVNPEWRGDGNMSTARTAYREIPRGDKWDVILRQAEVLFDEYETAIRRALGDHCGVISGD